MQFQWVPTYITSIISLCNLNLWCLWKIVQFIEALTPTTYDMHDIHLRHIIVHGHTVTRKCIHTSKVSFHYAISKYDAWEIRIYWGLNSYIWHNTHLRHTILHGHAVTRKCMCTSKVHTAIYIQVKQLLSGYPISHYSLIELVNAMKRIQK